MALLIFIFPIVFLLVINSLNLKAKIGLQEEYSYIKWGVKDVILIFLIQCILFIISFIIVPYNNILFRNISIGLISLIYSVVCICIVKKYGQSIEAIGLNKRNLSKILNYGIKSGSLYIIFWLFIFKIILYLQGEQLFSKFSFVNGSIKFQVSSLLLVVLIGPFAEELFYRGFFYPVLKKNIGIKSAIFFNSLFFSLFHGRMEMGGGFYMV